MLTIFQDCGQAMYWDIKRMSSSKEADLTAYLQGHTTRPGPVFSEPQQGGNLQQRRPYASMPIQGGTGQALSPSANPQPPSNTYSPQNHTSSLIQMVLEPCFLELCVNTGEYERSVSETDITHIGSDGDLFELIASSYYTLRAERNFLQLWHPKAIGGLLGKRMFRWSFLKPTAIVFRKVNLRNLALPTPD